MHIAIALIEWIWSLLTSFATEIAILELILCSPLKRRSHHVLRLAVFIPFAVFPTVYYAMTGTYFYMHPAFFIGWFPYSFSAMVLISALLLYICYDEPLPHLISYATAAHIVQNLIYMEEMILEILLPSFSLMHLRAITGGLMLLSAIIVCRFLLRYVSRDLPSVDNVSLVCFCVFSAVIVSALNYWSYTFSYANLATYVYQLFCCVLLLIMQFGIFDRSKMREEQVVMEQVYAAMEQQYRTNSVNIDLINRKCHDLRRQVSMIRNAQSTEDLAEDLKAVEHAITIYDNTARTGCSILDTFLTTMSLQCTQDAVNLTYIVDGERLQFMADPDILSLFGNALDNALECVRQEASENRIITLHVSAQGGYLKILVDNYCSAPVRFRDGLPLSTKEDNGYHGFGTRSIQYVVHKYNGQLSMNYQADAHRFSLTALIPLPAAKS